MYYLMAFHAERGQVLDQFVAEIHRESDAVASCVISIAHPWIVSMAVTFNICLFEDRVTLFE